MGDDADENVVQMTTPTNDRLSTQAAADKSEQLYETYLTDEGNTITVHNEGFGWYVCTSHGPDGRLMVVVIQPDTPPSRALALMFELFDE